MYHDCTIVFAGVHALEPKRQEALKAIFTDIHHSLLRPTAQLTTEAIEKVLKR